jgi:molybdenum cofactor cytidylyltransferase
MGAAVEGQHKLSDSAGGGLNLFVPEGVSAPEGILLAAGRSSRAGTFKMEVELAGKPLLLWSLEAMVAVCERIIVVAGFAPEKIIRLLKNRPRVEVTINENFACGMLTSIQTGIRLVRAPRFFLLPGDMPLVKSSVFQSLLTVNAEIAVPLCQGRRGHPVLLASSLIPELLTEPADSSLGRFIGRHGSQTVEVDDPGIFADLDDGNDIKQIDTLLRARGKNE